MNLEFPHDTSSMSESKEFYNSAEKLNQKFEEMNNSIKKSIQLKKEENKENEKENKRRKKSNPNRGGGFALSQVVGIAAAITGIVIILKKIGEIVGKTISTVMGGIFGSSKLGDILTNPVTMIATGLLLFYRWIKGILEQFWNWAKPVLQPIFEGIWNALKSIWEFIQPIANYIYDNVIKPFWENALKPMWEWMKSSIGPIIDTLSSWLSSGWEWLKDVCSNLDDWLIDGWNWMKEKWSQFVDIIINLPTTIADAWKSFREWFNNSWIGRKLGLDDESEKERALKAQNDRELTNEFLRNNNLLAEPEKNMSYIKDDLKEKEERLQMSIAPTSPIAMSNNINQSSINNAIYSGFDTNNNAIINTR